MRDLTNSDFDLVICDIDGCLSPESHAPIDTQAMVRIAEHNQLAIQAHDRPVITLCSGRPIAFVECLCRLIHNTVIPCIGENGVWMWGPSDNSFDRDPNITEDQLEVVYQARQLIQSTFGDKGVVIQPGKTASVALYHPDTKYLRSIMPDIAGIFEKREWPIRVSMTWLYINCDLIHVNKGTAIDRLLERTGITKDRTAGIGDTMGDRFIAERVSWFGCPANAEPEIQEWATYVSDHKEIQGVLDILERLSTE
ncbi:MAG: HAD family hydrolase [Planctomycetota bacterium]